MSKEAMRFSIASIKVRYSRSETGSLASRNSVKNEKNTAQRSLPRVPLTPTLSPQAGRGSRKAPRPARAGRGRDPRRRRGRVRGDAALALTAFAPVYKGEALEELDVLLVLEQGPVQRWDQLRRIARSLHIG